jgi:hypothetical protein
MARKLLLYNISWKRDRFHEGPDWRRGFLGVSLLFAGTDSKKPKKQSETGGWVLSYPTLKQAEGVVLGTDSAERLFYFARIVFEHVLQNDTYLACVPLAPSRLNWSISLVFEWQESSFPLKKTLFFFRDLIDC